MPATRTIFRDQDICAPCAPVGTKDNEDSDDVIIPWIRWVACVFGGILFSVIAVTKLLYRDPDDFSALMLPVQPLEIGVEERARQGLKVVHMKLIERIRNVFGPADMSSVEFKRQHPLNLWLIGEEQILFEVLKECLSKQFLSAKDRRSIRLAFQKRRCKACHERIVERAVEHFCEAIARVMIVHSWYPQVTSNYIVERMCRHSELLSNLLPHRLLLVVNRAACSCHLISTVALFYELRHTCHSPDALKSRLLIVFNKLYCR